MEVNLMCQKASHTVKTSGLTITTDGESDTLGDDDIDLSSLSDSDEDYYQKRLEFCLYKTVNKSKTFRKNLFWIFSNSLMSVY